MPLQSKKGIVSQNTQNNLETLTKNIQQLEPGFRLARISVEERIVFVHNHIYSNGKKCLNTHPFSPKTQFALAQNY